MNILLSHKISSGNLVRALLSLYIFFSIFLPPLLPKKIVFIMILGVSFIYCFVKKKINITLINPFIILLFFLTYMYLGYGVQDDSLALQFMLFTLSFFIIFVISKTEFNLERSLKKISVIFSALIIYMSLGYFSELFGLNVPFAKSLTEFFINNNLGFIGFREFGSFKPPMLHFISAPILMISLLLIYDTFYTEDKKKNLFSFLVILVAILLSGSRGIVLFSFIGLFIITFYRGKKLIKLATLLLLTLMFFTILINLNTEVTAFSITEKSNSVKIGHFISYIQQVNSKQLILGDGLASLYYSVGFGKITAQTELFFIDSLRYFGIFGTFIFFWTLLVPMKFKNNTKIVVVPGNKDNHVVYIIFCLYLLMSFTNPILLNSFGAIVVLWFWSRILIQKETN